MNFLSLFFIIFMDFLKPNFLWKSFPSHSDTFSQFILCCLNFLIVLFVHFHEWIAFFHRLLHYSKLLSLLMNFLVFLHFLFYELCVFFFCHLILYSSALCISTETIVIWTNFLTTFVFQFGSVTALTTKKWYCCVYRWIVFDFLPFGQRFTITMEDKILMIDIEVFEQLNEFIFETLLIWKSESLPWEV